MILVAKIIIPKHFCSDMHAQISRVWGSNGVSKYVFKLPLAAFRQSKLEPKYYFLLGNGRWARKVWFWVWLVVFRYVKLIIIFIEKSFFHNDRLFNSFRCLYVWNVVRWNSILRRKFGGNLRQNHEPQKLFRFFHWRRRFGCCEGFDKTIDLRSRISIGTKRNRGF